MISKNFKKIFLMFLVLLFFSISAVNAETDDNISISTSIGIDTANIDNTQQIDNMINIADKNEGTFTDLNDLIKNSAGDIKLNRNYTYDNKIDNAYINGIKINKDLVIDGNGFTINCNKLARIFNMEKTTLTLKNINIINGKGSYGGAIYQKYGDLIVINSTFNHNTAEYGGAIFHEYGKLTVINSTFNYNTATGYGSGGAIFSQLDDELLINSSKFTNNDAAYGGASSINGNTFAKIINSIFTNNNARDEGGAIEDNDNENLTIFNSTFTDNTSPVGGAIYNYRLSVNTTLINSSFINNCVSIELRGSNSNIIGCNFTNNLLSINIKGNNNKITNSTIFNNTQAINVTNLARNTTINYNRILNNTNNTGFNLDNNGINTNANLNWWGKNTPLVNGIILENYFVMNVNNLTSTENGAQFNYTFRLNTNDSFNPNYLPYFVSNVYTNITNGIQQTFDARFNRIVNVETNKSGQNVEYIFVTDNEVKSLSLFTKAKVILDVSAEDIIVGENATIIIKSTVDGPVTVTVDGKKYNVTIVNNSGFIVIPGLPENVYFVEVNFAGNDYYNPSYANTTFNVTKNSNSPDIPEYPDAPKNSSNMENKLIETHESSASINNHLVDNNIKTGNPLILLVLALFSLIYPIKRRK